MKKLWETGIILFSVCGFWGMIYPDLCFTEEVCEIIEAGDAGHDANGGADCSTSCDKARIADGSRPNDIFTGLCDAKPGQIRIKSRIFEKWKSESEGKGNGVSDGFSDE